MPVSSNLVGDLPRVVAYIARNNWKPDCLYDGNKRLDYYKEIIAHLNPLHDVPMITIDL